MVVQEKLCNCLHIYNVTHYTIRLYVLCNILITLCNIYILNIYRVGHGFCLYEQDTSISEYVQAATHTGNPAILCPSINGRFWFPARLDRVFNRRHSALCRGLKTSENAAGGRKMPFMDGHYLEFITKDFNAFLFRHSKERPLGVNSLQ